MICLELSTCNSENEVMHAEAKLSPKDDEKTKTIPINFHENEVTCKTQIFYILLAYFINYFSIVDSC